MGMETCKQETQRQMFPGEAGSLEDGSEQEPNSLTLNPFLAVYPSVCGVFHQADSSLHTDPKPRQQCLAWVPDVNGSCQQGQILVHSVSLWTGKRKSPLAALEAKPSVTRGFWINLVTAVGGQAPKAGFVSPAWFHDGTGGQHQQCCWEPLVLLLPGHQLSMGGLVAWVRQVCAGFCVKPISGDAQS